MIQKGDYVRCTFPGAHIRGHVDSIEGDFVYVMDEALCSLVYARSGWWVLEEQAPAAPEPAPECPECRGKGAVILFTSVSACKLGCGR